MAVQATFSITTHFVVLAWTSLCICTISPEPLKFIAPFCMLSWYSFSQFNALFQNLIFKSMLYTRQGWVGWGIPSQDSKHTCVVSLLLIYIYCFFLYFFLFFGSYLTYGSIKNIAIQIDGIKQMQLCVKNNFSILQDIKYPYVYAIEMNVVNIEFFGCVMYDHGERLVLKFRSSEDRLINVLLKWGIKETRFLWK